MNTKQKIVLWVGASLLAILLVYPPCRYESPYEEFSLGHRNILRPASPIGENRLGADEIAWVVVNPIKVDTQRLMLEIVLLAAIAIGGLWAFADNKNKSTERNL